MPTPRDTTLTLDELYNSYTPMSLTEAEWRVLAPDIGNLVRATSPSGYWRARDLLSTACRFVSLASPAGGLLIVDEAFTFANVERHRSLAAAAGAAGATPNSLANDRSRLSTMLKVHLGFQQARVEEGQARVEPLADDLYQALKAEAQAVVAATPSGRALLNATRPVLKRRHPSTSTRSLRTSWALEVLGAPVSFAENMRFAPVDQLRRRARRPAPGWRRGRHHPPARRALIGHLHAATARADQAGTSHRVPNPPTGRKS